MGIIRPCVRARKLTLFSFAEGSWDEVMKVIGQAHALVHQKGVLRVQSSMRVGTE